jgi:hypothetical protein
MVDAGLSQRQAAKALGVSQTQVRRDLSPNGSKSEPFRLTKAERRAEREAELGAKQLALPTKLYGVINADPPWRFEPYSRETGMDRAADNHYPTSTTTVIAERNVAGIAADDCVLFLWATAPMLREAMRVMEAWGFEYRSGSAVASIDARKSLLPGRGGHLWPVWSCAAQEARPYPQLADQSRAATCRDFACGIREIGGYFARSRKTGWKLAEHSQSDSAFSLATNDEAES